MLWLRPEQICGICCWHDPNVRISTRSAWAIVVNRNACVCRTDWHDENDVVFEKVFRWNSHEIALRHKRNELILARHVHCGGLEPNGIQRTIEIRTRTGHASSSLIKSALWFAKQPDDRIPWSSGCVRQNRLRVPYHGNTTIRICFVSVRETIHIRAGTANCDSEFSTVSTVWGYSVARRGLIAKDRASRTFVSGLRGDPPGVRCRIGPKKPRREFSASAAVCRAHIPAVRSTRRRREAAAAVVRGAGRARLDRCRHRAPKMSG